MSRYLYLIIAWTCLGFGFAGIFLPLLPTTPFLLAALWAFSKSSPELSNWVRNHPTMAPYIRDWDENRTIPVKAKIAAVAMMAGSLTWLALGTQMPAFVVTGVGLFLTMVAVWLVTRPSSNGRNA